MKRDLEQLTSELHLGRQRVGENAWVLFPQGVLDSTTSAEFKDRVSRFLEEAGATSQLLLDMAGIKYVSSIGLGALIGCFKRSQEKNCGFALYDAQLPVRRVLEISKLDFLTVRPEALGPDSPFTDYVRSKEALRPPPAEKKA